MPEQRRNARFPAGWIVFAREISADGNEQQDNSVVRGELRDISSGGFCLASELAYPVSSVLKCEIFFPGSPIGVPTLAQVRWTRRESNAEVRSGMLFLLE
jgi:hypothetical protein